jgi:hypothetical protein
MRVLKTIKIDECITSLTTMTKAGYTDEEKGQLINALEIQSGDILSKELFDKIKNALITIAVVRAFGVTGDLRNYFSDTK